MTHEANNSHPLLTSLPYQLVQQLLYFQQSEREDAESFSFEFCHFCQYQEKKETIRVECVVENVEFFFMFYLSLSSFFVYKFSLFLSLSSLTPHLEFSRRLFLKGRKKCVVPPLLFPHFVLFFFHPRSTHAQHTICTLPDCIIIESR